MSGTVRPATLSDVDSLMAQGLRSADLVELAAVPVNPRDALERGVRQSVTALTVEAGGVPCAIFGVAVDPRDPSGATGLVWLLGTDGLLGIQRQFLRESARWLEVLEAPFETVGNAVHHENELHIRWLEWLGFSFGERAGPFIHFSKPTRS